MKNKYISYFINSFAAIGFFVVACSVADSSPADSPDDNPSPVLSNVGKYQVEALTQYNQIIVLNTENGNLRTYYMENSQWKEFDSAAGRLTVSH
tara:strand:+ start:181 stop:462 length:282 start_codon:yes stop_codon:yes gene_type:complete